MDRPTGIKLATFPYLPLSAHSRPLNNAESLRKFRTIAFGIEMMRQLITKSDEVPGRVDAAPWWALVPEVYREDALRIAERMFALHRNSMLTDETLDELIVDIAGALGEELEVKLPGDSLNA